MEFSSVDGRSKYATMQQGTTIEMLAYTDMTIGSNWYDTTLHKVWTWSDLDLWWVVGETMIMSKQTINIQKGELVVPDRLLTTGCEVADVSATDKIIGINVWNVIDSDLYCVIAYAGIWDVLCSDDSNPYAVGDFLVHDGSPSAEDGQAKRRLAGTGHMAICLEAGMVVAGGGLLKCQVQTTERN